MDENTLTVTLKNNISDGDIDNIKLAINMISDVSSVKSNIPVPDEVRYGLQVDHEIGAYVGLVHVIRSEIEGYYILSEDSYCDLLRKDCVKIISESHYNFLLPRNERILAWVKEMDTPIDEKVESQ